MRVEFNIIQIVIKALTLEPDLKSWLYHLIKLYDFEKVWIK